MREFNRANELIVERRLAAGDVLQEPREIQHYVYFTDRIKCSAAEAAFRIAGFETQSIHRTLKSQIVLKHEAKIQPQHMNVICEDICAIVEHYGGEYAGWDAEIISKAS